MKHLDRKFRIRWLVAVLGLGFVANVATAASVSCATTKVNTAQASKCWDRNVGTSFPGQVQFIDFPSKTPTRLDGKLQLPNGYVLLDGTHGGFGRFSETLPGVLNIKGGTGTGRFAINATSAFPFILVIKQANSWAAFLLGSNTGTFTTATGRSTFARAYLFGKDATVNTVHTPLPPSAWLLGSALLGLIGIGRRRKTKTAA